MKKNILLFFFLIIGLTSQAQESMNMTLLGHWDNDTLAHNGANQTFNEIWGYAAYGQEYAIMGSAAFVHFFNVTDPANLYLIAQYEGGDTTTWRDIKTFQNRAYSVSDATNEGLMIFNLEELPTAVSKVSQTTEFFGSSHNIFIDEPNGRLYAVGANTRSNGVIVLDIATNPDVPTLLASVEFPGGGYVHDIYVKDNIAYCSHGYNGFYIWDMNDPTTPVLMASNVTGGYNHSSWLSADESFVLFAEEVPRGLPLGIMDLSNLANNSIEVSNTFMQPLLADSGHVDNTPHNPFIIDEYAYVSYYEDGIQIWDLTDPLNPVLAGYYDTFPFNLNYANYWGCWGTYPFLPSRRILASDRKYGLHVLQFDLLPVGNEDLEKNILDAKIFPNPSNGLFSIKINEPIQSDYSFEVFDISGRSLNRFELSASTELINLTALPSGFYYGKISLEGKELVQKLVIH